MQVILKKIICSTTTYKSSHIHTYIDYSEGANNHDKELECVRIYDCCQSPN